VKKLVIAFLVASAIFAALAVPAFARNTNGYMYNNGGQHCVNNNAYHANGNHDSVYVYENYC